MATSGTASLTFDVAELIEEAFERCGLEFRTGYDGITARRSLNLLAMSWANYGINLWTVEQVTLDLVAGTATYTLEEDTIDILEGVIRSSGTDYTCNRVSRDYYANIPNKTTQGRPNQFYLNRLATPTVSFWAVPDVSTYDFIYWRMRRIQDITASTETLDIPWRFIPAMVSGLAYMIAMKRPDKVSPALRQELKLRYEDDWTLASSEDTEDTSTNLRPRIYRV